MSECNAVVTPVDRSSVHADDDDDMLMNVCRIRSQWEACSCSCCTWLHTHDLTSLLL